MTNAGTGAGSISSVTRKWAWVAGASAGLGLAFAEELARRGYDLVLFARRGEQLGAERERLQARFGVEVVTDVVDLAVTDLAQRLEAHLTRSPPVLAVYNAAYAPVGDFLGQPLSDLERVVAVNVRGPLIWARVLGAAMLARGGGALVFMSSLAGNQGSPRIATYAASKAFNTILAEGLWAELPAKGIHVLVCTAGAVRTPGYAATATHDAPGILDAAALAAATLERVGRGPRIAPGWVNGLAALLVGRWLPRKTAIAIMARNTHDLTAGQS